jgi:hypothetical protein
MFSDREGSMVFLSPGIRWVYLYFIGLFEDKFKVVRPLVGVPTQKDDASNLILRNRADIVGDLF